MEFLGNKLTLFLKKKFYGDNLWKHEVEIVAVCYAGKME